MNYTINFIASAMNDLNLNFNFIKKTVMLNISKEFYSNIILKENLLKVDKE